MLICFESLRCFVKPKKKKKKKKEKLKSLNHSETSMSLQNRFMQLFFFSLFREIKEQDQHTLCS